VHGADLVDRVQLDQHRRWAVGQQAHSPEAIE
jgi:hypothetical protein